MRHVPKRIGPRSVIDAVHRPPDLLVEDDRVTRSAVGIERVVRNHADPLPSRRRIQLLAGIPTHRIERKQRKPRYAGACLDRLHQGSSDSLPARPPMHEELGDIGAMRLIGWPRRVQRHAAGDAEVVPRDQHDRARVGALECRPPPLPGGID